MFHLAKYFAIEIDAYAIMSNHFHLVVFYDPQACETWSDEEVAYRWFEAFPPRCDDEKADTELLKQALKELFLEQPTQIRRARNCLGSLSAFMKHLKQPIAWRANQEDGCRGHFFEGRFYSGALLSESAVVAAMAYVDLNPVRAKIAKSIEDCDDSSISQRLKLSSNSPERLFEALSPLVSGLEGQSVDRVNRAVNISVETYTYQLRAMIQPQENQSDQMLTWFNRVASFKKRQRAYGFIDELNQWYDRWGWKHLGTPLAK